MRGRLFLDKPSDKIWPPDFCLSKIEPTSKVISVLEIIGMGDSHLMAISSHCCFVAVSETGGGAVTVLYIINLCDGRSYLLKRLTHACTVLQFHPQQENMVILATDSCDVYKINAETGDVINFIGHQLPVIGIYCGMKSCSVLTYSCKEVLMWDWSSGSLSHRLRVDPQATVVWAGDAVERHELVVAFECGNLIVWEEEGQKNQISIPSPKGVDMRFTMFTLYSGSEWIVGGGTKPMLVTYSLINRRVIQVVQLPQTCPDVHSGFFLPSINPKYTQALLLLSLKGGINLIDHATSVKVKTLNSQQNKIYSMSVSNDGFLLSICYSNCISKLYTLASFFPQLPRQVSEPLVKQVKFKVVEPRDTEADHRKREKRKEDAKQVQVLLDKKKWYPILRDFGHYPSKYRHVIWAATLQLPRNYSLFSALLEKGTYPKFTHLSEQLASLPNDGLMKHLQCILSCLAHWSPFLASVEFIPEFVFPFVKLLHTNLLVCFELTLSIILNWCRLWFEFWPKASVTILNVIEQIVCDSAPDLLAHLMKLHITSLDYAWPLLTSAFSWVLSRDDWLLLWDHIISNPPHFLLCVTAAFVVCARPTLMTCDNMKDVKDFFKQETWISVKVLIDCSYKLQAALSLPDHLKHRLDEFIAIPRGGLPIFNIGPKETSKSQGFNSPIYPNLISSINKNKKKEVAFSPDLVPRKLRDSCPLDNDYADRREEMRMQEEDCLNGIAKLRRKHLCTSENLYTR